MNDREARRIEPLGNHHRRADFSCGVSELDDYLRRRARQDRDRYVAAVFVLTGDEPNTIAGFYTLSSLSILAGDLPEKLARGLPRYPEIPATLVGRLAVDLTYRGRGYGELLLMDALRRILDQTAEIASVAAVVDAKTDEARSFYVRYGFLPFLEHSNRLFLPVKTIKKILA